MKHFKILLLILCFLVLAGCQEERTDVSEAASRNVSSQDEIANALLLGLRTDYEDDISTDRTLWIVPEDLLAVFMPKKLLTFMNPQEGLGSAALRIKLNDNETMVMDEWATEDEVQKWDRIIQDYYKYSCFA